MPTRMTWDIRDRAVDLAIAAFLALFPLLPTGPTYVGLDWPWALEGFFLLFAAVGLLLLLADQLRTPVGAAGRNSESVRLIRRGYVIWLIPASAATLLGLVDRVPFDAALWQIEAQGLVGRLGQPMNQAADPFYPLRVGLTALEGGLMFWLLSVLLFRTADPDRRVKTATSGCLWGMALVSVVAIGQYLTGANLHEYWVRANPDLPRSHATLDDPNALASYLALGIGLASGVAWSATNGRPAVGIAVLIALALVAMVTTESRAGWAGLILAALTCIALLPDALVRLRSAPHLLRRAARSSGFIMIAALFVWAVGSLALPKRTTSVPPSTPWEVAWQTIDPRVPLEKVLKGRQLWWRAGLDLAGHHRGLAAGFGAYPRFLATYPGSAGPENVHNYFIQVLAEAGVVGMAALVVLLVAIGCAVWPSPGERDLPDLPRVRLAVGLSAGLLAFVLTWLTGHPLLTLSNQLWLATVLAVGVAAIGGVAASDRTKPAPPGPAALPPARNWLLHRLWVPGTIIVTLLAAVPRVVVAARADASRAYAAGVYAWESAPATEGAPADVRFRWTRGRAAIREPVRGAVQTIPIYLARPLPTTLRITVGGVAVDPITLSRTGWHTLSYDLVALLGKQRWRSEPTITVEFRADPVFIPAADGASNDTRELGVGLGVVGWSGRDGAPATPR